MYSRAFLGVWPSYLEPWISEGGIFVKSAQQDRKVRTKENI